MKSSNCLSDCTWLPGLPYQKMIEGSLSEDLAGEVDVVTTVGPVVGMRRAVEVDL